MGLRDRITYGRHKTLRCSSLPASFLTSPSQCLPASETIKTPNWGSGRLCGNAAEMFIISTACSGVEYRKTHSRTTLSVLFWGFFGLPRLPTIFLSPALCAFLEVKPIVLDSLSPLPPVRKPPLVCDAERMKRGRDVAHLQSHCGLHRGFLYAGARLG